jgi:hypothetical protein
VTDHLEALIDAQQYLIERAGLQSKLSRNETEINMPDGATIYYSERRKHFVLSCNYNGRYETARAAVDDWLFYLTCKLNRKAVR